MDDDDEVVKEIDVFLSKGLKDKLWLFQYPVRPADNTYDDTIHISARVKPKQMKVQLEVALDTSSTNYSRSRGEHIATNVDGPVRKLGDISSSLSFPSGMMDKQMLTSSCSMSDPQRYAIALIKNGELHLTPLHSVVQVRPSFTYLDKADITHKQRVDDAMAAAAAENAGEPSDEDEEDRESAAPKLITARFGRVESDEARARRLASYEHLRRRQGEEAWISCNYNQPDHEKSAFLRSLLCSTGAESTVAYSESKAYLKKLVPEVLEEATAKPEMPSNVLSLSQLKNMPLTDKVRALLESARLIRFGKLMEYLPQGTDRSAVVRCLVQYAVLVQGCWVVKSEVIYPKDTFSPHSNTPSEVVCRARDYLLWRFTQTRSVMRRDIASVVKLPPDELKEMLEQVARPRFKQGWQFKLDYDQDFVDRHQEVVHRQQLLWDAKYQQLAKMLKLPPALTAQAAAAAVAAAAATTAEDGGRGDQAQKEALARRRRRHTSSRSKSDMSDTDGDNCPMEVDDPVAERPPADTEAARAAGRNVAAASGGDVLPLAAATDCSVSPASASPGGWALRPSDDNEALRAELRALFEEKLRCSSVLTMVDVRHAFVTRQSQCDVNHVLAAGASEQALRRAVLEAGAAQITPSPTCATSTIFLLLRRDDGLDDLRAALVEIFRESQSQRISTIKKKLEDKFGSVSIQDLQLKKVLKEYCVAKGSVWHLKGTVEC